MLVNYDIKFRSGDILTGEMLSVMNDQPNMLLNLLLNDRSDGVISGMHIYTENGILTITKGVYKHNCKLYYLESDEKVSAAGGTFEPGKEYAVVLAPTTLDGDHNIKKHILEIRIIDNDAANYDSIILCRFNGEPRVPRFCQDLLNDDFDLIPYQTSSYGNTPTYSPQIFSLIKQKLFELYNKGLKALQMTDMLIIYSISANGVVPIEIMVEYLRSAGVKNIDVSDRREFLHQFINAVSTQNQDARNGSVCDDNDEDDSSMLF